MQTPASNSRFRKLFLATGLGLSAAIGGAVSTQLFRPTNYVHAEAPVAPAPAQVSPKSVEAATDLSSAFKAVAKAVQPAVVQIQTRAAIAGGGGGDNPLRRFFHFGPGGPNMPPGLAIPGNPDNNDDNNSPDDNDSDNGSGGNGGLFTQGTGSGVIMAVDGSDAYILTNNHVVAGATKLSVTLSDSRVIDDATVVGVDPRTDLAVVKITASNVAPATWGDSSKLEQGDWVVAFGSPFGYGGSITHGIVSALDRQVGILGAMGFEDFIQTDAPINPGNSGGPLVNLRGEVIGINQSIASRSGSFSGLGFAVPSQIAHDIFDRLRKDGHISRGFLGIGIIDAANPDPVIRDQVKSSGYTGNTGVYVREANRGTPAFGKVNAGDVITALNGQPMKNTKDFRRAIANTAPGTEVTLTVVRDGKPQDVKVTLGQQPSDNTVAQFNQTPHRLARPNLESARGLQLRTLDPQLSKQFELDGIPNGAVITNVQSGSLAERAGLQPGDVITRVANKKITSASDAAKALKDADLKQGIQLQVANKTGERVLFLREQ
jgi:serine protease Do